MIMGIKHIALNHDRNGLMRKLAPNCLLLILVTLIFLSGCTPTGEIASHQKPTLTPTKPILPTRTPIAQPSITPAPTRQAHLAVDTAALQGTTIYFWAPWIDASHETAVQLINTFNQENLWGINVVTYFPGSSNAMFQEMVKNRSGDFLPSVAVLTVSQMNTFQDVTNLLVDMDSYLRDSEWGLPEKDIADFSKSFLQQNLVDDRLNGIPAQQNGEVLFYNQTWAEELGFDSAPSSPSEFKEQSCAAARSLMQDDNKDNDGTGGWIISRNAAATASWMAAFGSDELLDSDLTEYQFHNHENLAAITYLRDLFDNNCSWISRLPTPYDYFANRQALFYSGSLADIPTQVMAQTRSGSSDSWSIIRYPALQGNPIFLTHGSSYSILSANPQEQLASWLLVSWLVQPEQQSALLKTEIGLPVSTASAVMTKSLIDQYPQWAQSVDWMPLSDTLPQSAEWRRVSPMMEDAVWQLYQHTTLKENLADILSMLDQTILETREHTPQD